MVVASLEINGTANTGKLDLYANGIVVTTYSFNANNKFVLSERLTETTLTSRDLHKNVKDIDEWYKLCVKYLDVPITAYPDWKWTVDGDGDQILFGIKLPGEPKLEATFNQSNKQIIFGTRGEWKLTSSEFRQYLAMLFLMLKHIEENGGEQ